MSRMMADACLRMATSIGPDVIILDPRVPDRLVRLLRAHPVSATARIDWLAPLQRVGNRNAAWHAIRATPQHPPLIGKSTERARSTA